MGLEYEPQVEGESAGVMLYLTHKFRYCFGIRMKNGHKELFIQRIMDDVVSEDYSRIISERKLTLEKELYTFIRRDEEGNITDEKDFTLQK